VNDALAICLAAELPKSKSRRYIAVVDYNAANFQFSIVEEDNGAFEIIERQESWDIGGSYVDEIIWRMV
jgi:molecular chaperone DnaK (HSP70)